MKSILNFFSRKNKLRKFINSNNHILMALYDPLVYDGRVKRAAETLSSKYDLTIFTRSINKQQIILKGFENTDILISKMQNNNLPNSFNILFFWIEFILVTLSSRNLIIYSNDFYLGFLGALLAKLTNTISVFDSHELIVDFQTSNKFSERLYYFLEKYTINMHQLVITANKERSELMQKKYGLSSLPLVIRNITKSNLDINWDKSIYEIFYKLNSKKYKYVIYSGDVNYERGINYLIEALSFLSKNIKLVIVGDGPDFFKIRNLVRNKKDLKDRIILLGRQPENYLQTIMSFCHIGIVIYSLVGKNNYFCASNKIYDYTQAKIPIVCSSQPVFKNIVRKYKIGEIFENSIKYNYSLEIAKSIIIVMENYDNYKNNLSIFNSENNFNLEQDKLLFRISKLIKSP